MKKISVFLALLALFFCDLALAAAVATSVTGSVSAQAGSAPARVVRQGDQLNQGDTVITGANSTAVLKFDDGSVAALTQNSRMTVTAYQYNRANESGNSLLSLITGGMRVITGLIGKHSPDRVAYRAATATIGIRGSDGQIATAGGDVIVAVNTGAFSLTKNGQTFTIPAGQAIHSRSNGTFTRGSVAQVLRSASTTPAGQTVTNAINSIINNPQLNNAVNNANPGTPPQGQPGQPGQPSNPPPVTPGTTGGPQGGGAGGGGASGG